jgi:hypothetical protein
MQINYAYKKMCKIYVFKESNEIVPVGDDWSSYVNDKLKINKTNVDSYMIGFTQKY